MGRGKGAGPFSLKSSPAVPIDEVVNRLLFVDDEPFVLRALKRLFEMEGFEVVVFDNPKAAIALLETGAEFQVIGSDYRMPEMTGAEFLQKARELSPRSYRLLISAVDEFNAALDAINRGEIFRFIPKPWSREQLLQIVRGAVEDYHLRHRYQEMTALLHSRNAALEAMNRSLEAKVAERAGNLLDAMVTALDVREAGSDQTSRRVSRWARRIAEELKLAPGVIAQIEQGALLHDIGKIGICDATLRKNGPLDANEWREIRRTPELGYKILSRIPFLMAERTMVLQHREKWDGSGYPLGMRGEEISLGARIFHVADAYDAIRRERPFRPRGTYASARSEIIACATTQFDPRVVSAFCAVPQAEWEAIGEAVDRATREANAVPDGGPAELRIRALAGAL